MKATSELEERLASQSQQKVAQLVKALPDEAPSMVWRSGLNQALLAESNRLQRKRLVWRFARPTLGLGLACALAAVVFVVPMARRSESMVPGIVPVAAGHGDLAASVFQIHRDDVRAVDLTGAGLNATEASDDQYASTRASQDEYSESDLDL